MAKILFPNLGDKNVEFLISDNCISIRNLPEWLRGKQLLLFLKDSNGVEFCQENFKYSKEIHYRIKGIGNSTYYLNVYYEIENLNKYKGLYYGLNVCVKVQENELDFIQSPILDYNKKFYSELNTSKEKIDTYLRPSKDVQSDNPSIIALARVITSKCLNTYQKIKEIHDWVASNIYYDIDALNSGKYIRANNSAIGTYNLKRSVCQGYSNLFVALCRACGIPSVGMLCYSIEDIEHGGWNLHKNLVAESNHVISFAYVDGRWSIIDVTWDSSNTYENYEYHKRTGGNVSAVSHKYFDVTLAFISQSHRFTQEWIK